MLIPPPRRHRHRYYGVLVPNAPLRGRSGYGGTAVAQTIKLSIASPSASDPLLPDDIFMGNVGLLITKLTYTVTWAPAAARPFRSVT